jgi:hypothetical protein
VLLSMARNGMGCHALPLQSGLPIPMVSNGSHSLLQLHLPLRAAQPDAASSSLLRLRGAITVLRPESQVDEEESSTSFNSYPITRQAKKQGGNSALRNSK